MGPGASAPVGPRAPRTRGYIDIIGPKFVGRGGSQITEEIRQVLSEHARLVVDVAEVGDDDDLFGLGMTSHASVRVMLGLEDAFGVEFPEEMLQRSTFGSIRAIERSLTELLATAAGD